MANLKDRLAERIDKSKIEQIESSGNPNAVSSKGAVGIRQVTQPVVTDYNKSHGTNYNMTHMKDTTINRQVSDWYFDEEIPRLLKAYKLPVTQDNILRAYNQGIGSLARGNNPKETVNYIRKYNK